MTAPARGRLSGKVAVITGGAGGIGAGTARRFHAEGARVVVADVDDDAGHALVAELGDGARYHRTDVTDEAAVAALVDAAAAWTGRLDVMFNNAGIVGAVGPVDATDMADADLTVAIDLRGVLLGMKHAARVMKPQRSGAIISTSSPAAMMGGVGAHVYSAVKAGVIGLSNSVAAELRRFGVRSNVVVPGAVASAMTAELVADGATDVAGAQAALERSAYMDRALRASDVAAGVLFLASDEASHVTGVVLPVDAGMTGAGGPSPLAGPEHAGRPGRRGTTTGSGPGG